jgi:hypothetical protein
LLLFAVEAEKLPLGSNESFDETKKVTYAAT